MLLKAKDILHHSGKVRAPRKIKAYYFKRLESSFLCVAPALLFLGGAKFCVLSEQLSAVKVVFVVTTF
jgi:hypothetical protein